MATKEELFEAVRTLKTHCRETECNACVLKPLCHNGDIDTIGDSSPYFWPDPEEGGADNA